MNSPFPPSPRTGSSAANASISSEEQQRDTSSDSEQGAKDDCRDRVAQGLAPRQLVVEKRLEQAEHDNEALRAQRLRSAAERVASVPRE